MYLDFRKAFHSIPRKRLIKKLERYGITGNSLKWFKNFLNERKQRFVINGKSSKWSDVLSEITQGSILSPLLLIIYMKDLRGVVGNVCKLFTDDCKLYCNIESEANIKGLHEDIERLCKWSRDWLLGLNIKKCKVISFGNIHFEIEYSLTDSENNSHTLSLKESECDLGILFKKNLKFEEHIDKFVNKGNRISGLSRKKFTHIDTSTFLTLYKSLVRSHLDYVNLIFYPTTKKCK